MQGKQGNPLVLRNGLSLGSHGAETDDDYLFECFIKIPAYDALIDFNSPKMILSGRTGAGKTAIMRYLKSSQDRSVEVDPFEVSLNYIANSDIITFLHGVGADLDLLFQILWKHVLCVEYIRLRYGVTDPDKWVSVFARIVDVFRGDVRRASALRYMRDFDGLFWETVDRNIKEITDRYERKLSAEFGADLKKWGGKVHYGRGISQDKKSEIRARCKKIIITSAQLADLSKVIELLSHDRRGDAVGGYFLLIDRLDENWIDDSLRFKLIRALIESLRSFRKIRNLKIIVALRSDVLERVVQETQELGFQREKYDDYIVTINWTRAELRSFISDRVRLMVKRKFGGKSLTFNDIFPRKVDRSDPFVYIMERTLDRPRDLLAFCNECLRSAVGSVEVSAGHIKSAEREYSRVRHQALIDEWRSAFPSLAVLLSFLAGKGGQLRFCDITRSAEVEDLVLRIWGDDSMKRDPIYDIAEEVANAGSPTATESFVKHIFSVLYRVGAVGVKIRPTDRLLYSHIDVPILAAGSIADGAFIRLHAMLHRALNIHGAVASRLQ